ncbi:Imm26 family immunity protein [Microbulbifer sp. OS29]|uniref:Imm26 family immunity protein n=1 Tax=Microbulbifer okhotskensis TaxID=2926617 RepID=A0A9X2J7V8_9GAMM|nr:Imm26 family immunity protein [Microbulbifer okhotskensis]MCO1336989.1 Imm26 family immunity protein [Microbulbifer okhotskensis]
MYPFVPTKASQIQDGDFFYIPLSNGNFACGRLLLIEKKSGRKTKRILVGLHEWSGEKHPTNEDIHQCKIIEQGVMHINSIGHIEGKVVGYKSLDEDDLKPLLQFEAGYLLNGFENMGKLPVEDYKKYSRRTIYGLNVISLLADKHFVENS